MCCNHSPKATKKMRSLLKGTGQEHWAVKEFSCQSGFCSGFHAQAAHYVRGWNMASIPHNGSHVEITTRYEYNFTFPHGIHLYLPPMIDFLPVMFLADDLICTENDFDRPPHSYDMSSQIVVTKFFIPPSEWRRTWYKTEVFDDPDNPWLLIPHKRPPLIGKDAMLHPELTGKKIA